MQTIDFYFSSYDNAFAAPAQSHLYNDAATGGGSISFNLHDGPIGDMGLLGGPQHPVYPLSTTASADARKWIHQRATQKQTVNLHRKQSNHLSELRQASVKHCGPASLPSAPSPQQRPNAKITTKSVPSTRNTGSYVLPYRAPTTSLPLTDDFNEQQHQLVKTGLNNHYLTNIKSTVHQRTHRPRPFVETTAAAARSIINSLTRNFPTTSFDLPEDQFCDQIVNNAVELYGMVIHSSTPQTAGYHHQVMNLACAACHSKHPSCDDMRVYYTNEPWMGDFVKKVFKAFMYNPDKSQVIPDAENATGTVRVLRRIMEGFGAAVVNMEPILRILGVNDPELASLVLGVKHFHEDLWKPFREYAQELVNNTPREDLPSALLAFRTEHDLFIQHAVLPGFDVVVDHGEFTRTSGWLAKTFVPFAARRLRECSILLSLWEKYGSFDGGDFARCAGVDFLLE
ncbi:hypothetical protein HDV00_001715 [Rhizophlyctis rosea]|nr:hypothetical protein HDV00_001715 [Rhizophlyctis rosea]